MGLPLIAAAALGVQAAGSIAGGIAQGSQAHYAAQVAANNAVIARQNEAYSAGAGAAQIEDAGLKARQQSGGVKAGLAANGLSVDSGSAADVQTGQRELSNLSTDTVANRAALQVYGYNTQATNFQAQSNLDEREAKTAWIGGVSGAAGDVARAAPSVFSGGPSSPGGGGDLSNSGLDSTGFSSLLSGEPSVAPGSAYGWMNAPGNPTDPAALGLG